MESEIPWLFQSVILNNRVHSVSYLSTTIGDLFEVLSLEILGGKRIHFDKSADGIYENGERLWECKAAQTRHYFKLTGAQTDRNLSKKAFPTDYIFWAYYYPHHEGDGGLTARCNTTRDILKYVNENIKIAHVVPAETMVALIQHKDVKHRIYNSWHDTKGNPYRVYQFPHYILDGLRWRGDCPQTTTLKSISYKYCGERFKTKMFTLVKHHRPAETKRAELGEIPF